MINGFNTLTTAPENTFAHGMLIKVFPGIVAGLLDTNAPSQSERQRLLILKNSLESNTAIPEPESRFAMYPDNAWSAAVRLFGQHWVGQPSYISESLFYFLFLESFGFFDLRSPNYSHDPFLPRKMRDLISATSQPTIRAAADADLDALTMSSLWGNLGDSAHRQFRSGADSPTRGGLLVDDTERALAAFHRSTSLGLVADNAGQEMVADLLLVRGLLRQNSSRTITIYLKQRPYFISDATANDFDVTVSQLAATNAEFEDLPGFIQSGRLRTSAHWFFQSPLHYRDAPADLMHQLESHDVIIMKGDLHYRRLLGDLLTPPSSDLSTLLPRFRADLVILRTLKSDICAGVPEETVARLAAISSEWRFSGKYGVIHYIPNRSRT